MAICTRLATSSLVNRRDTCGFHRGLAHEQCGGDLRVGGAGPDRGGHLTFAVGEGGESLGGDALSFRRLGVAEMGEQRTGYGRRDDRIAGATTRTALMISAGGVSLTRNPLAPARSALTTCSSAWKVVSTITCGGAGGGARRRLR